MASNRRPEIIVAPDSRQLARIAAERLLARVTRARDRAAVCLTGGSSPEGLYRLLAMEPYRSKVPWSRVHWFMGDDRFVRDGDALSNMGMARRLLLDHIDAPADNVHPIATNAASPDEAARRYQAELERFYGSDRLDPARPLFDLVLMGLGDDGHTASLFPNAPALEETRRWVTGVAEAGLAPFVPRVTLTFPALASTREMLFLVTGEEKHDILMRVLSGEGLPARRAYTEGELVWLVDRAAGPRPDQSRQTEENREGGHSVSRSGDPSVVVVMGVAGCGKSTIASMLAQRLNWIYEDGDWFHPPSNIEKMHGGEALTDEDRWPWLHGIAAWIDATRHVGNHATIACSALKRAYRDILVGERRDVRIVHLKGERDLIARRLAARDGHFMPPSLLDSQFAALEEPQADERPIVVSIVPHPREIVDEIVSKLDKDAAPSPRGNAASI